MSNRAMTAVWEHSRSKGAARLVLLALADEANDQGEVAAYRRSHTHLAAKANTSRESVKRALRQLGPPTDEAPDGLGEVLVTEQGGGRVQTSYAITLPGLAGGGHSDPPAGDKVSPQGGQGEPPGGTPHPPPSSPCSPSTPSDPTPLFASVADLVTEFDVWWAVYPRRAAKGQARVAYGKARKTATAEDLLAGATRYRDDPNRLDQFTRYPATWLNGEGWHDPPLPPRTPVGGPRPRPAPPTEQREGPSGRLEL